MNPTHLTHAAHPTRIRPPSRVGCVDCAGCVGLKETPYPNPARQQDSDWAEGVQQTKSKEKQVSKTNTVSPRFSQLGHDITAYRDALKRVADYMVPAGYDKGTIRAGVDKNGLGLVRSSGEQIELSRTAALHLAFQLIKAATTSIGSYWPQSVDGLLTLADIHTFTGHFVKQIRDTPQGSLSYEEDAHLIDALREREERDADLSDLEDLDKLWIQIERNASRVWNVEEEAHLEDDEDEI
jgi:hypothetical protein